MKVVLTKQLCEISGYFKTLSEDPECKEIEISDEYKDFIDDMNLYLTAKDKYIQKLNSLIQTEMTEMKYLEQRQFIRDNCFRSADPNKFKVASYPEIHRYKQLCDYFQTDLLNELYLCLYSNFVLSNDIRSKLTQLSDLIKRLESVYGFINPTSWKMENKRYRYDHAISRYTPKSYWIELVKHIPLGFIYLFLLECPYPDLIEQEILKYRDEPVKFRWVVGFFDTYSELFIFFDKSTVMSILTNVRAQLDNSKHSELLIFINKLAVFMGGYERKWIIHDQVYENFHLVRMGPFSDKYLDYGINHFQF